MPAVRLDPYQNIVGVGWGGTMLAGYYSRGEGSLGPEPHLPYPFNLYARLKNGIQTVYEWGGAVVGSGLLTEVWRAQELEGINWAWSYTQPIYILPPPIGGTISTTVKGGLVCLNLGKIFSMNADATHCEYGISNKPSAVPQTITRAQLTAQTLGAGGNAIKPGARVFAREGAGAWNYVGGPLAELGL